MFEQFLSARADGSMDIDAFPTHQRALWFAVEKCAVRRCNGALPYKGDEEDS